MPRPTAQAETLPIAQWSERHRVISLNMIPLRSWVHLHLKSVKPQSRTKQFQSMLILKEESCPKSLETPWSSVQSQLSSLYIVWIIGRPIFCFDNPQCWVFSMIPLQSSTNSGYVATAHAPPSCSVSTATHRESCMDEVCQGTRFEFLTTSSDLPQEFLP